MVTHNSEGSMGIVMNKDFRYHISLNQLVPNLESAPSIPVYKGGPVGRNTIFSSIHYPNWKDPST